MMTMAAYHPLFLGCPATMQVMARPRPIALTSGPRDAPSTSSDPSDLVCDPPEAPLLRAMRRHQDGNLASRD
jgi:hypothetical protein